MTTYLNLQKKWLLYLSLLGVVMGIATSCQSRPSSEMAAPQLQSSSVKEVPQADLASPVPVDEQAVYRSDRLGLQFNYEVQDFAINESGEVPANTSASQVGAIDIWTRKHDQKIRLGEYEGGTEYPAHVRIVVYDNPQKLAPMQWIQESQNFLMLSDTKSLKVGGQKAIAFSSDGLYRNDNIVFLKNDATSDVVVITLETIGLQENDAPYRRVFDQIVTSLSML